MGTFFFLLNFIKKEPKSEKLQFNLSGKDSVSTIYPSAKKLICLSLPETASSHACFDECVHRLGGEEKSVAI